MTAEPFVPQMEPVISDADRAAVAGYLASGGWLTEFERTREFERSLEAFSGARHCSVTPSGTLALFLALAACGIGRDDEVIVPDLTMAASATAVLLAGARVVFADIEPQTLCLDFAAAEARMTPRTRAVMFVSLNGRAPAGLPAFVDRCRAKGIRVIEDAAQSLGSFTQGRHLGTFGDCGCLSFSSQKIVTTGQGGAVLTNDDQIARRMRLQRDFGRAQGGSDHYLEVGWNLKFTDLQAAIGVSQMHRLDAAVAHKRWMFGAYRQRLAGIDGLRMPETDLAETTPWFVDVLVEPGRRSSLIAFLRERGIGSREFYPALHATPALAQDAACPVAEDCSRRGLWLPSSLRVGEAEVERVCGAIRAFFTGRGG